MAERAGWLTVRDDQTSGRTKTCVACDRAIGEQHHIICSVAKRAYSEASREGQSGPSLSSQPDPVSHDAIGPGSL